MTTGAKHTVTAFDEELAQLRAQILEMGERASTAMTDAMSALNKRNTDMADAVIEADKAIDALHHKAEASAVNIIALRAPMADDLRTVVAAIKMSALLERTADYAKNIARRVKSVSGEFPQGVWDILSEMSKAASAMLTDVVRAYAEGDEALATAVIERDDIVDELHDALTDKLLKYMIKHPDRISQAAHLLFIGKHIERIGDQATNVAEMVGYAESGDQADARDTNSDRLAA